MNIKKLIINIMDSGFNQTKSIYRKIFKKKMRVDYKL